MELVAASLCVFLTLVGAVLLVCGAMAGSVWVATALAELHATEPLETRATLLHLGFGYDRQRGWQRISPGGATLAYRRVHRSASGEVRHELGVAVSHTGLRIARASPGSGPAGARRTGDPEFDAHYRVSGAPEDRALLTAPVRAALVRIARCGWGEVWLRDGMFWVARGRLDARLMQPLAALGRALGAAPVAATERLRRLAQDPEPAVRVNAYLWIAARRDRHLMDEVGWPALGARDRTVRAAAALALQAVGRIEPEVWTAIVDAALSPDVPTPMRTRAAAVLAACGSDGACLRTGEILAAEAAMRHAAVELLRAAGARGEPALLRMVRDGDQALLALVLRALTRMGSAVAVPVLRERQRELSVLQRGVSRAIDHTVRAIQLRVGGVVGGLTLAAVAPQRGALSLAPGQRSGRLSATGVSCSRWSSRS